MDGEDQMAATVNGNIVVPQSVRVRVANRLRAARRLPIIPVLLLSLVVVAGIFAPWISPHDPLDDDLRARNRPPAWMGVREELKIVVERLDVTKGEKQILLSDAQRKLNTGEITFDGQLKVGAQVIAVSRPGGSWAHPLGTDHLGRDIVSRIIYGARISIIVAGVTLGIGGTAGVALGLAAGWHGGWIDELIMRLVDIKLAIPLILIAMVLVISLGQSFAIIVAVLAIWIWPRFARQVRAEVLQLKKTDYVDLARVAGASTPRILLVHIFPGTINTLIVVATLQVGIVILLEATLSFLGAGVPPPTPAWGSMVADGRDRMADAWWISTMPGLAIMMTVMSLNLLGDWLRDTLDPRLRQLE